MVEDHLSPREKVKSPLVIAHRGNSAHAPENTLAAFRSAIEAGADGIELDVRLSRDGVPVVIHDADLRRVGGLSTPIADLTSAELANVDVGSWFNAALSGGASSPFAIESVPSLEQALDLFVRANAIVYIELKADGIDYRAHVEKTCDVINRSGLPLQKVILKSFNLKAIKHARTLYPHLQTAALFEPGVKILFRPRASLISLAAAYGATDLSIHWSLLNRRLLAAASHVSMPVTIWTVDHPRWIVRARRHRIKALITNYPARLIAMRDATDI